MSYWTHIQGLIRVSESAKTEEEARKEVESWFITERAGEERKKDCNVPFGSEGSVQVKVIRDPSDYNIFDKENLDWYTPSFRFCIVIVGNLRDRDSSYKKEIDNWWNDFCEKYSRESYILDAFLRVQYQDLKEDEILIWKDSEDW